jgi:hypothetical protein
VAKDIFDEATIGCLVRQPTTEVQQRLGDRTCAVCGRLRSSTATVRRPAAVRGVDDQVGVSVAILTESERRRLDPTTRVCSWCGEWHEADLRLRLRPPSVVERRETIGRPDQHRVNRRDK